jgi:Right handed beta helix region
MKGLVRVGIAAAVVVGLYGFAAAPALAIPATTVQCGDTITQDTKLDNDLIDCPPNISDEFPFPPAITIGADDVTLDLNGHTISAQLADTGIGTIGVDDSGGYDHVTIKNGTITGFELPIYIYGGATNTVTDMTLTGTYGAHIGNAPGLTFTRSTLTGFGARPGLDLFVSQGGGSYLIEGNVVSGGDDPGISATIRPPARASVLIRDNVVAPKNCTCPGIEVLADSGIVVEHNVVSNLPTLGIYATGGLIRHNRVEHNDVGITALGATVVSHNTASYNAGDGIRASNSVSVSHNTANYNGNLGINADPTVIDGGGNKARGNGNPLQCVNVFCK